jgi:cyclophilin family peptidyl-prolyl cis-trans isomerase
MSRKWLCQRRLLVALVCTIGLGTSVLGQDNPEGTSPPTGTPATTEAPAKAGTQEATGTPDTDDQPAPAKEGAASTPGADKALFSAKLDEWRAVLKSLRTLKARYGMATSDEATAMKLEWDELIKQGELLIPELRTVGKSAYAAAEGQDRAIGRFLMKLLADDVSNDRYEPAYDLGNSLVASGCDSKEVFESAGIAAFCVNDFDGAETLLKRAQDAGGLTDDGLKHMAMIGEYKVFWAREKVIREKEAAADDLPRVRVTTNRGELIVELLENEAPETVGNFIHLVEKDHFYDGLTFHRVLGGFMAQGGCPQGTGSGGPGYMIKCELGENHRKHFRGSLSMAHAGKDTGGSQFFLTFVPTPHLNGQHTVFGRVIEGLDVLANLQRIDPSNQEERPVKPDKIIKVEVLRKRDHEYKPNKSQ